MQTGLKSTFNFIKLTTLNDIIENNYTAVLGDSTSCRSLLDASLALETVENINRSLIIMNATNLQANDAFELGVGPKKLTIGELHHFLRLKYYSCWVNGQNERKTPLYLSEMAVFKGNNIIVYNSGIDRRSIEKIIRLSYSVFEMSCLDNYQIKKLILPEAFTTKESSSCMASQVQEEAIITAPISIYYLMTPTIILFTGHAISAVIFVYGKHFLH